MQKFDHHIIGPFSSAESQEFRRAVENAGRHGFELVGIAAANGWLYAAVKRPAVEDEPIVEGARLNRRRGGVTE